MRPSLSAHNMELYVRRMSVMDDCEEGLVYVLNLVNGVVYSGDLLENIVTFFIDTDHRGSNAHTRKT